MQAERWQRIKEILDVALRLDAASRPAYLDRICEGDTELREEVESLLAAHEEAGDLFETPPLAEGSDPLIGARLGNYEITEAIGTGGMGSVYRAVRADAEFEREVAIKVLRRGLDLDSVVRHFRLERQIMATLEHPNIASLLDGGTTPDGLPYFVMEFIRGKPIDHYCEENGFTVRQRLEMFREVCAGVEFAHRRGIVHRDIKPSNILVTAAGVPKLLDFGIAKILNPESLPARESIVTIGRAMTPDYASPEQLNGQPVSPASDVFSLGIVLCELLAGSRPHPERTPFRRVTTGSPRLPSRLAQRREFAGDLDSIVLKAVQEEPAQRYATAGDLAEDIRRYLDGLPVIARKQAFGYRLSKFVRRQRAAVASVAVTVAAAAAVLGVSQLRRGSDNSAPPQVVPLTSLPGEESQPAVSPDGKHVAFVWGGEDSANPDIYLQPVAGGQAKRLTTDPAEDISPVWSPDGTEIAWLRLSPEHASIWRMPVAGGIPHKVANVSPHRVEAVGRHLDWSPSGILAVTDQDTPEQAFRIVLINVKDGSKNNLTLPPDQMVGDFSPAFSSDGKWLAFIREMASGVGDLYVIPSTGGPAQRVTFDNRYMQGVTWAPNNRFLLFSSERSGIAGLWEVAVSGGSPVRVPLAGQNSTDPAFSRDGGTLVFAQVARDANIWRIGLRGAERPAKLIASTQYDSSPQYSPDGTHIAFRSTRSGSHEIWVSDAEGRGAVQLTHFGGVLTGTPRWSPDSRQIAFDSRPDGQADIYTVPATGGAPRRITGNPSEDVVPSWSGDGRWIYFASNRSGAWQVWRAPASGGREEQVTVLGGFAAFESPTGDSLYYAKGRNVAGLWRKRLPEGAEEAVIPSLKAGLWGYWAVAANGIYFLDRPDPSRPLSILFHDFTRHTQTAVAQVERPPSMSDSGLALLGDGPYVLYTQLDQSECDLVAIEHFRSGR